MEWIEYLAWLGSCLGTGHFLSGYLQFLTFIVIFRWRFGVVEDVKYVLFHIVCLVCSICLVVLSTMDSLKLVCLVKT